MEALGMERTALAIDHVNQPSTYRYRGEFVMSNVRQQQDWSTGLRTELRLEKITGNWRYELAHFYANDTYDINDFGISFRTNYNTLDAELSYETFEAGQIFQRWRVRTGATHRRRNSPGAHTRTNFYLDSFFLNDRFGFGLDAGIDTEEKLF